MDKRLRGAQLRILEIFSKTAKDFALTGGTALELFYLHHRFSADLDFFSPKYDQSEIDALVSAFKKETASRIRLESKFVLSGRAEVCFYKMPVKGARRDLKIDFVQDVMFNKPRIKKIKGLRVYNVEDIYLQKISAVSGTYIRTDEVGGEEMFGNRREPRDAFDIYMLSKKIKPLYLYLQKIPRLYQRGMIHWYRSFSRQDLQLGLLDLDIYDKNFDSKKIINYLESQIKQFLSEVISE